MCKLSAARYRESFLLKLAFFLITSHLKILLFNLLQISTVTILSSYERENMKTLNILFILLLQTTIQAQNFEWKTLATGAGGWITGLDIHQSGSPIYARSDVGSAYRYNANSQNWENIVTANNLPQAEVYWNRHGGVLSIVSAPSNANKAYIAYFDAVYKSSNQGDDWTKTNFPAMDLPSNDDDSKLSGERLSVDPINENLVYFATPDNGLFRTEDSGTTWQQITAIPNGFQFRGVRQVLFDVNSGSTNGKTNRIYVTVDGEGVFLSLDAGASWTNIGFPFSGPIFLDTEIDASGNIFIVGRDDSFQTFGIHKYNGTAWSSIQNNGTTYLNVAIDPFNSDRIIALSEGFTETAITSNASATNPSWSYPERNLVSNNIPWIAWSENNWFTIGEMIFDPIIQNKLWISDGIGVWNVNSINTTSLTWEENSAGQEHLVSNDLVVNQDGKVVTAHWDRPLFLHNNVDDYPAVHQPSTRFNSAWDMDVSPTNRNFIVSITEDHRFCCYDSEHRNSGYSTDGGLTWTPFTAQPDAGNANSIFGNIAVSASDTNTIVWLPTGNQDPYYTNDLGVTWQQATLPNNQGNCCLNFNFVYKKALVADQVLPNTFYIYNWENGSIYMSNDGGASWIERTALQDFVGWNAKISATPNHGGHLWYSHGAESVISVMEPLKRSIDGGITWQTLSNTSEVLNHAIGVPLPNATYPTIFMQGRVNGVFGYWMSSDEGVNWTNLGTHPNGIYDVAKVMEADPFIPSRIYVGFSGNGFVYGQDNLLLSIADFENNAVDVIIYPNPSSGKIYIKIDEIIHTLSIYSSVGQLIKTFKDDVNSNEIDMTNFADGLYFIKVNNKSTYPVVKK